MEKVETGIYLQSSNGQIRPLHLKRLFAMMFFQMQWNACSQIANYKSWKSSEKHENKAACFFLQCIQTRLRSSWLKSEIYVSEGGEWSERDTHTFQQKSPDYSSTNPDGRLPENCWVDEQIILTTDGSREEGGLALLRTRLSNFLWLQRKSDNRPGRSHQEEVGADMERREEAGWSNK